MPAERVNIDARALGEADDDALDGMLAGLPARTLERIVQEGNHRLVREAHIAHDRRRARREARRREWEAMTDEQRAGVEWERLIIRLDKNSRELEAKVRRAGGLLYGSMTPQQAYEIFYAIEGRVAELRKQAERDSGLAR